MTATDSDLVVSFFESYGHRHMKCWNSGNPIKMPDFARKRPVLLSASMLLLLAGGVVGCDGGDELTEPARSENSSRAGSTTHIDDGTGPRGQCSHFPLDQRSEAIAIRPEEDRRVRSRRPRRVNQQRPVKT